MFEKFEKHVAGFVVVFGIFSTFGEFGPGNNTGLYRKLVLHQLEVNIMVLPLQLGKLCLCGCLGIPSNSKHYAYSEDLSLQVPFYVSSALCLFSAFLTIFFVPPVGQDAINKEDEIV